MSDLELGRSAPSERVPGSAKLRELLAPDSSRPAPEAIPRVSKNDLDALKQILREPTTPAKVHLGTAMMVLAKKEKTREAVTILGNVVANGSLGSGNRSIAKSLSKRLSATAPRSTVTSTLSARNDCR